MSAGPCGWDGGSTIGAMTSNPIQPLSEHATRFRVRYCECDPMGVAHHASYVPWLEIGRTELLRQSGVSYAHLEAQGLLLVIVKLDVRYRRPVRYDDLIEVRTKWSGGSRVKILHEYEVHVLEPGTPSGDGAGGVGDAGGVFSPFVAAAASTTLGCVDRQGSIRTLPDWLTPAR